MDKATILTQTTEQTILLNYLQLTELPKSNISSPFAEDKKPSFTIYKNNTFKCHSTGKQGDCWQLVADLNNLNCKTEFNKVLEIITKDLNIQHTENKHFSFSTKEFTTQHLDYFTQANWNVTQEILKKYNVFALDKFEYYNNNKEEITKIKLFNNVIGFAYTLNSDTEKTEIYIPKQEKTNKFFLNKFKNTDIFGLHQLPKNTEFVIICAGKKDCLILNANGFPTITFRSENHNITQEQINNLNTTSIFICYDNDLPGINASKRIAEQYQLKEISLPSEINDIADFFKTKTKEDFQKLIDTSTKIYTKNNKEIYTIFHQTEEFISEKYKFRYNKIKMFVEISPKNSNTWTELNENNLYLDLQKNGIKISSSNLQAILKSDFCKDFNPIQDYFESLPPWDNKTDHIANLAKYILAIDPKEFEYHLKKWLIRAVFCTMDDHYFNKQALVLVSNQNDGKTSFWNWISPPPLSAYYTDRITTDKDGIISLARNFMINIDELASLNKQDTKQLKALFSMKNINVRVPYGRNEAHLLRRCSFVGSTNEQSFLADETGSVRWLCFNIKGINWNYAKHCNVDYIWAQAFSLWQSTTNRNQWDLTKEEITENEKRNAKFRQLSTEQELISKYFIQTKEKEGKHFTSTDILVYLKPLGIICNSIAIGRAMHSLNYEKTKYNGIYGYWLEPQKLFTIEENKEVYLNKIQ